jgi:hypothetical protein
VEHDRRAIRGPLLQPLRDRLLALRALAERRLVPRFTVQGEQQAADVRVSFAGPLLSGCAPSLMLAREAPSGSTTIEFCRHGWLGDETRISWGRRVNGSGFSAVSQVTVLVFCPRSQPCRLAGRRRRQRIGQDV